MLVAVEPPVAGPPYGLGTENICYLLLATEWEGCTLWLPSKWPIPVYVLHLLSTSDIDQTEIDQSQAQLIEWGELHPTCEEVSRYRNGL